MAGPLRCSSSILINLPYEASPTDDGENSEGDWLINFVMSCRFPASSNRPSTRACLSHLTFPMKPLPLVHALFHRIQSRGGRRLALGLIGGAMIRARFRSGVSKETMSPSPST